MAASLTADSPIGVGLWVGLEECADLGELRLGEAEVSGWEDSFDLLGVASANDGRGDGRVVERPGDGDDSGADAVARADGFEEVGDRKVAGEQRLLVVLRVAAEVVLGEGGDSL